MRPLFGDPKTHLVFKRIFGQEQHKDLLIELLNALLQLDAAHRIVDLSYLSLEQAPRVKELKWSYVDVKCVDAQGTRYVVEMQVLPVKGFEQRIVYNLCKAYSPQLGTGEDYPTLNDVVAVTICDFTLWPDAPGDGARIPLLSRWAMREELTGARRLQQIRHVFLELEKYRGGDTPEQVVDKWAYFFRETSHLRQVPPALAESPYREAMEVARVSGFTAEVWEEYDREKIAEQDARGALELAEERGEARGEARVEARGEARGEMKGLRAGIEALCAVLGIELTHARHQALAALDEPGLKELLARLGERRRWD